MHLWKFHATPAWLAAHEKDLQERYGSNLALIGVPGKSRSLVQITVAGKAVADRLVGRFGGAAEKLARDWQTKLLAIEKRPPLRIGKRLVVVTEEEPRRKAEQLIIPAAGAFGTGEHATTAMCLRLLEETSRELPAGWSLLDAGTGTGILALAAHRFGAREVLGRGRRSGWIRAFAIFTAGSHKCTRMNTKFYFFTK